MYLLAVGTVTRTVGEGDGVTGALVVGLITVLHSATLQHESVGEGFR